MIVDEVYVTCVSWKRTNKANLREPKVSQKGFSAKRNLREPKIEKPIECEALREPKSKPKAKRKAKPWTKLRMAREPKPKTSVKQAWTSRSKPLGRAPMLKAILISQLTSLTQEYIHVQDNFSAECLHSANFRQKWSKPGQSCTTHTSIRYLHVQDNFSAECLHSSHSQVSWQLKWYT